jgi:hypothetical protein
MLPRQLPGMSWFPVQTLSAASRNRTGFDAQRPLCLMHIPKSGGMSLMLALTEAFGGNGVVRGFDRVLYGAFDQWHTLSTAERAVVYTEPKQLPQPASLIMGHFALSTLNAAYPDGQAMTVLREPVSRLHTDADLEGIGTFADYVRHARRKLEEFLSEPAVAMQTDNLATRMLLWPHPLIPVDDFIDPANDRALVREARRRLRHFAFVDVFERPDLIGQLETWLGRPLAFAWHNETRDIPLPYRAPLASELSTASLDLLDTRSRLDLVLWRDIAARSAGTAGIEKIRQRTMLRQVARFGALMTH